MGYEVTTGVILYWNPYQPLVINISHHVWFYEYNSCLSIKDKHNTSPLLFKQDPKKHAYNSYLLNLIPCETDLASTPFRDITILTYEIE